ncbi:MAG TPA: ABC transporter ATP-binding protein [Anaerolineae bacterium]|nr:ABC transporter ATP-binding protein [Anaerolineae bacterium]
MNDKPVILDVKNLRTTFKTDDGIVHAVNGISYQLHEGETLGLVGESGCGKSVSVLSIMRLLQQPPAKIEADSINFFGKELLTLSEEEMRAIRGDQIAMIFQDPMTSLNPVLTIGLQLTEGLRLHQGLSEKEALERAGELLDMVGIPMAKQRLGDYPHQFSGGMRQRAIIAMALSCNPSLLIADEPTTALDVTIQAQIIDLVKQLREQLGQALIWITHDLGVIAGLAQRVAVMYAGSFIEFGSVKEIYHNPHHPYTVGLLGSLPRPDTTRKDKLYSIKGEPPDLLEIPPGCPFYPRCTYAVERCKYEKPILESIGDGHLVACWEKERVRKV